MTQTGDDLRNLRDSAMNSGNKLADDAMGELARLRAQVEALMADRVTPVLGSAADTVEDYGRRARASITSNADALADSVKERPLITVAVAAIGGYLLGRLMGGASAACGERQR